MDAIERKILETIDANAEKIKDFGRDIWCHAELGYREFRTAEKFNSAMKELGMAVEEGLAITGSKAYLKGKDAQGPTVAVIGELDALPIANHSQSYNGAAHCCGHNAQMAATFGAALAMSVPEVRDALGGNIAFMTAPSEEFVDIEYKSGLRREGKARYGGGKCELIRIGAFDDIDVALGHHAWVEEGTDMIIWNSSSNAFVNKTVKFFGKKAHAASCPEQGIDALAAMNLAFHCIDVQRESFRDQDTVRVHGFVSNGGEAVNVISDVTTAEFSVRAKTIPGVIDASKKVDRALRAAAIATGCGVEIETIPGYVSTQPCPDISAMEHAFEVIKEQNGAKVGRIVPETFHLTGSTDYGDLSSVLPVMQVYTTGFKGELHNNNMEVIDEETAYVLPAKILALTAYRLLKDSGAGAKALADSYHPIFTKDSYVEYMESMLQTVTVEKEPLSMVED